MMLMLFLIDFGVKGEKGVGLKAKFTNGEIWNFPDKGLKELCKLISNWHVEKQKKEQEETTLPETISSAPIEMSYK